MDNTFVQEQYKPIKIKSIKHIKNEDNVYDLEVKGPHTYCISDYIIGHNSKARLTRGFFRSYIRKMQKLNIACVMTAHLTSTIGGYGPSKEVTGGTILQYAPSAEVRFSAVKSESDIDKSALGASVVKIRAEIVKSRFGTLGKRVKFDLDMEKGLDPYAGLFDILRDYEMITPVKKDWETQQQEQTIGKSSTGWWAFIPWKNEKLRYIYDKMIQEGLTKSGKWREKQLKEFCRNHDWFLKEVQDCLQSIYNTDSEVPDEVKTISSETIPEETTEDKKSESKTKTNKKTKDKKEEVKTA